MITYKTKFIKTDDLDKELNRQAKKNYILAAITKDEKVFGTPSHHGMVDGYLCVFAIVPTTNDDDEMDFGY